MDRQELVIAANKLIADGTCCCWSEVAEALETQIAALAKQIGKSTAYVLACTIDDVEAHNLETLGNLLTKS